jgi:hypothetical protein
LRAPARIPSLSFRGFEGVDFNGKVLGISSARFGVVFDSVPFAAAICSHGRTP